MSKFEMTYPYARSWGTLGTVQPGEVIDADENPDGNFFKEVEPAKKGKTETSDKTPEV